MHLSLWAISVNSTMSVCVLPIVLGYLIFRSAMGFHSPLLLMLHPFSFPSIKLKYRHWIFLHLYSITLSLISLLLNWLILIHPYFVTFSFSAVCYVIVIHLPLGVAYAHNLIIHMMLIYRLLAAAMRVVPDKCYNTANKYIHLYREDLENILLNLQIV